MTDGVKVVWWHRLLLVFFAGVILVIACISLAVAYDVSRPYRHFYSWHADGIPERLASAATKCHSGEYIIEDCGEFYLPAPLIDDMIANKAFSPTMVPSPRTDDSDLQYAEALLRNYDLRYIGAKEFVWGDAVKAFGVAIAVIIGAWMLLTGAFLLILWVAHGTTRLKA